MIIIEKLTTYIDDINAADKVTNSPFGFSI
jgi:hypothetical protein